ncbi:MAG: ribosome small subunit-dependent GTPase A [Desulforhopalus sp.]|nr:ribosome small subunit-dependent GTPase A [Desulforhopalus sp.]
METTQMTGTGEEGLIVAHYGVAVEVLFAANSERRMIRVKRNSGHVVGDKVTVKEDVLTRLPRTSEISRMDARGGSHLVGANLDILGIVVSCEPLPPPGFIDRAIVAARKSSIQPILIINKSDLPCFAAYHAAIAPTYQESTNIFVLSAANGTGLAALSNFFSEGHRGIFIGPTGVGKSSILNSLLPDIDLQVGEISESKKRGRHTTTVSTLHYLNGGGEIIDSPGFNDFGLIDVSPAALAAHFPGFEKAGREGCRFRDCKHKAEPGCAVTSLLHKKEIDEKRYTVYLQILTETEALPTDSKYREMRHRRKKNG